MSGDPDRTSGESEGDEDKPLCAVRSPGKQLPPLKVRVLLDNCSIPMELDMGASRSLMSKIQFEKLWPNRKLEPSLVKLHTYSNEPLHVFGKVDVEVVYNGVSHFAFACCER